MTDLLVIGGGPGGYVAAIRAAQLGMKTSLIDENPSLGGTCLRIGCIPSKALIEAARNGLGDLGIKAGEVSMDLSVMMARKERIVTALSRGIESLVRKNGIERIRGRVTSAGSGYAILEGSGRIEAGNIIVATGSHPAELPGIVTDGERIGTSTEALSWGDIPGRLVVIGAGYIGLELGLFWRRLGAEVIVLEYLDRILPGLDSEVAAEAVRLLEGKGIEFRLSSRVKGARRDGKACIVEVEGTEEIHCDRVLVAVGRRPDTSIEGPARDGRGYIIVDEDYRTSIDGLFAVGDVIGGMQLAHKASEEGIACVEKIAGKHPGLDYDSIPAVVYTDPEIASVGRTEDELVASGTAFRKGKFPFMASGRARTLGDTSGFVKVLADEETDRILGVHIIGPHAGEVIAEAAAVMRFKGSAEDLSMVTHSHPSLSEALGEAALASMGRAIHI